MAKLKEVVEAKEDNDELSRGIEGNIGMASRIGRLHTTVERKFILGKGTEEIAFILMGVPIPFGCNAFAFARNSD
jgi:hypothetical protein